MSTDSENQHSRNVSRLSSKVRYRMSSEQWKLHQNSDKDHISQKKETQELNDLEESDRTFKHPSGKPQLLENKCVFKSSGDCKCDEDRYTIKTLYEEWNSTWTLCDHDELPLWLQDNEYLISGHRPPLYSYIACIRSIFHIHSETVNIWSHLLGCIMFIVLAKLFLSKPTSLQEKLVFAPFFVGAVLCLGFSFTFHMVCCHSISAIKVFSRLDYCGISLLITGSFIPWIYYAFYCQFRLKVIYISLVLTLGISATIISLWEKFREPEYRQLRATVFSLFAMSAFIPAMHFIALEGWEKSINFGSTLIITGFLYGLATFIYASRIPELIFPGKCDIWFQSHQIFHILVVIATFINYCDLTSIADYRQSVPDYCF